MFAVICNRQYYEEVETAVNTINSTVVYKSIGEGLSAITEINKVRTLPFDYLFIDVSCIDPETNIIAALKQIRLQKDDCKIIIFAPGLKAGDPLFSGFIKLGIYNLLVPEDEDFILLPALIDLIDNPMGFQKAIRYETSNIDTTDEENPKSQKIVNKIIEKTIEVEKEKIIGPVIIAVSGLMSRIGTTHTAIAMAHFLSKSFNVAIAEYGEESSCFTSIKNSYDVKPIGKDAFVFNGISFYPSLKMFDMSLFVDQGIDYIILDMGVYDDCKKYEFWRCHERIMVCGTKDWELTCFELFLKDNSRKESINYVFSFTDSNTFSSIENAINPLKCFLAPYNPIPYALSSEYAILFNDLLKSVVPSKVNKKKGFFRKYF